MTRGLLLGTEGVLCSTARLHRQAWEWVLSEYHIPSEKLDEVDFSSLGRDECLDVILNRAGENLAAAEKSILVNEKNEWYRQLLTNLDAESVLPGVLDLLGTLKKEGWRLCVVTPSKNVILILRQLRLAEMMDAICDGNDDFVRTGYEKAYERASRLVNIPAQNCYVWENHPERRKWAEASGMQVVYGSADEAQKALIKLHAISGNTEE